MSKAASTAIAVNGDPMAVHIPAGMTAEHLVAVIADYEGHIVGSRPDYFVWFPSATNTATREVGEVFNAGGANVVVRVRGIWIMPDMAAVTGAPISWDINKISGVGTTGSTVVTPRAADSNSAAIPAGVTARYGSTAGAALAFNLFRVSGHNEETAAPAAIIGLTNQLPQLGDRVIEIVLRNNEGIQVKNASGTVGGTGCLMLIAVDN